MPPRIEERLAQGGAAIELLRLPAALFGLLLRVRERAYDWNLRKSYRVDVPVISIGNLTTGGTGKTPLVAWLVKWFQARDLHPAILSRGYKAAASGQNDEARLLAELFPDVPHVQNANRVEGGRQLVDRGIDVILLDDGFQHRRLVRDLDLVLIDATRPFGFPCREDAVAPGALLPRGLMRERPGALARAHALVLTRTDLCSAEELARLEERLEQIAPGLPRIHSQHKAVRLRELRAGDGAQAAVESSVLELNRLDGTEVDLLSGIGNPDSFQRTVEALGGSVCSHRVLGDHHHHTAADLAGLGGERPLVVTAKDAVKLAEHLDPGRTLLVLDIEVQIEEGLRVLEALLEALPASPSSQARAAIHAGLSG